MITLSMDPESADAAHQAVQRHSAIECGERRERWLPVVTEAADDKEARDLHGWLESLPGVEQVGVIMVGFPESEPENDDEQG